MLAFLLFAGCGPVFAEENTMNEKDRQFLESIIERGDRQYNRQTQEEFMLKHIVVREDAFIKPYSFDGYAVWRDITRKVKNATNVVFQKAAQVTYSTWALSRLAWKIDGTRLKAGVFFPDDTAMKIFVQDRANPFLEDSKYLRKQLASGDVNNTSLKRLTDATLAFRGTWSKTKVKSIDLDIVMLDEVDEHDAENIEFVPDRMLASKLAWMMAGSQPSFPDFGINAMYKKSTASKWLIRCSCGHWSDLVQRMLEDPEMVIRTGKSGSHYVCEKCGKKLNNQRGENVATNISHPIPGFLVSQLYTPLDPFRVIDRFRNANTTLKRKAFYISVIGVPYTTDEEQPVTQTLLDQFRGDQTLRSGSEWFTYFGADQGDIVHMVFAEPTTDARLRIIGLAKLSVLDEVAHHAKIEAFSVYSGIIDAMPNKSWALRLALRYPDNIRIQYFSKRFAEKNETIPGDDEGVDVVFANRDESLQDTIDAIKAGMFIFPDKTRLSGPDLALAEEFDTHLKNLIRERGEDASGKPVYQFKKKIANHFGMALNSLRLAYESSGESEGVSPLVS